MKLTRRTLALVLTAVALTLAVILTQQSPQNDAQDAEALPLFGFTEIDVQAIEVETADRTLVFERDDNLLWQMTAPDETLANQGAVSFLASVLATATRDRPLDVPTDDLGTYGLDQPFATLDITLTNQETHRLVLGSFNFNRTGLYALVDPPANPTEPQRVFIVPADFEVALNRPLEEWKEPEATDEPAANESTDSPADEDAIN